MLVVKPKRKCGVCGRELSGGNLCNHCFSTNRLNIDLCIVLCVLFALPSIFIFQSTGEYLYLSSGLIGLFIYFFNIRYIRDDDKTLATAYEVLEWFDEYQNLSNSDIGLLDFLSKFQHRICFEDYGLDSNQIRELVLKQQLSVQLLSAEEQREMIDEHGICDRIFQAINDFDEHMNKIFQTFKFYNRDMLALAKKRGPLQALPIA